MVFMSTKEMLQELTLNNVLIKQLSGSFELLALKTQDIIKLAWFVLKASNSLKSPYSYPEQYLDQPNRVQNQQPDQELLELEIYYQKNPTVN